MRIEEFLHTILVNPFAGVNWPSLKDTQSFRHVLLGCNFGRLFGISLLSCLKSITKMGGPNHL